MSRMASTNLHTSSAPLSPGAKALGLFLAALALALIVFFYVALPTPPSLVADEGPAHISFAADRASVLVPGDCVMARWEVGGIRTVTINGRATVGTGEQEICITTDPVSLPTLRVRLQDGELREYLLTIGIVARKPEVWFLAVLAVLALLASVYALMSSIVGSRLAPLRSYWRGAAHPDYHAGAGDRHSWAGAWPALLL
jgi:hypothetical protein